MTTDDSKKFVFIPNQDSHFDLCRYCKNCDECIDKHWKTCRLSLDRKALKERRPICCR